MAAGYKMLIQPGSKFPCSDKFYLKKSDFTRYVGSYLLPDSWENSRVHGSLNPALFFNPHPRW